jgi:hypothetical protein
MAPASSIFRSSSRPATAGLRLLSLLVALLLTASSLAQVAHFLLVPHAFCAEHGELLELGSESAGLSHADSGDSHEASVVADGAEDSHDHCQLLARNQREQLLPPAPGFELPPAPEGTVGEPQPMAAVALPTGDCLASAPKTSPPRC